MNLQECPHGLGKADSGHVDVVVDVGNVFRARFDSECVVCDGAIWQGDRIALRLYNEKSSGKAMHEGCIEEFLEKKE